MKKVLCWGTFDLLHEGHKEFFKDAKKQGDYLVVVVISDKTVYENKRRYPINNQKQRAEALRNVEIIDKIIEVSKDLDSNFKLIKTIKPAVIVFGYDQKSLIEQRVKEYLNSQKMYPKYHYSKEFAGGKHSSHLRD